MLNFNVYGNTDYEVRIVQISNQRFLQIHNKFIGMSQANYASTIYI